MKRSSYSLFFILFFTITWNLFAQKTKNQLEKTKKENIIKIAKIEKILKETSNEKKATLGQLKALNQQINNRETLVRSIGSELKLLNNEILDLSIVVSSLQNDLIQLKYEYAEQIYFSYKVNKGNNQLMFLFASQDFYQLLQRLKYLKQYTKARRLQAEQIEEVAKELNEQKNKIEKKRTEQQILFNQQVDERRKLTRAKRRQSELIALLTKKENQLHIEVRNRKSANRLLNTLIAKIIGNDVLKSSEASTAEVASVAELTRIFESKKNKLTWPVNSGFISSKFGKQKHPVLKRVTVINDGIDIQTEKGSKIKAVFDGEVTMIAPVTGKNNIVMIRHGDYLTVYARLKTVNVKKGQYIKVNDVIGEIYTNREGISELEFQVYKGITKLNPENWLAM